MHVKVPAVVIVVAINDAVHVVQETAWEVPAAVVAARGGGSKVWGPAAPTPPHPIRPPCPLFSCFALLAPRSVKSTFAVPLPPFCFLPGGLALHSSSDIDLTGWG